MADTVIYKDIDLSFTKTLQNDISVLINGNSIKNAFINNLMILSSEKPFNNDDVSNPFNLLHQNDTPLLRMDLADMMERATLRDNRIHKIDNINVSNDADYRLKITTTLQVLLKSKTVETISTNILINRY